MGACTVNRCSGSEVAAYLGDLARLRIRVFRDFPYLYDGSTSYEEAYLARYVTSPRSVVVLVRDGRAIVGAATGMPLADEEELFQRPFLDAGEDLAPIFYFAESVLLPEYRGQGLGHRFFAEREAHVEALGGFRQIVFCAVDRPADHPRRPASYRDLHGFWARRGYRQRTELTTALAWRDLDDDQETPKPMTFWSRDLA